MNRTLLIVFPLAALAGAVARLWLHEPAATTTPAAVVSSIQTAPPPPPAVNAVAVMARLKASGTREEELLAADADVRKLTEACFPAVCNEAFALPESERRPVLRLLLIRWAELDGLAALTWAKAHLWKENSQEWRTWLTDLAATWFAAQPKAAAEWMAGMIQHGETEQWAPSGGHIAIDDWMPPGHLVETAQAMLPRERKGVTTLSMRDRGERLAVLIRSRAEIDQLLKLIAEYPPKRTQRGVEDGVMRRSHSGENDGTAFLSAVEKAWPRVDPAGFREYAHREVIGVMGEHLPLLLAREDCRIAAQPATIAAQLLTEYPVTDFSWDELQNLADAVAEKDPAHALEFLRGQSVLSAATAIERFVLQRDPGDWRGAIAALEDLLAPDARASAVESCLTRWHATSPDEANAFLAASGWSTDRLNSVAEMLMSAPPAPR